MASSCVLGLGGKGSSSATDWTDGWTEARNICEMLKEPRIFLLFFREVTQVGIVVIAIVVITKKD